MHAAQTSVTDSTTIAAAGSTARLCIYRVWCSLGFACSYTLLPQKTRRLSQLALFVLEVSYPILKVVRAHTSRTTLCVAQAGF